MFWLNIDLLLIGEYEIKWPIACVCLFEFVQEGVAHKVNCQNQIMAFRQYRFAPIQSNLLQVYNIQNRFIMSNPVNWNDMTSSEDEDSWFDDDEPQDKKTSQPSVHTNQNTNPPPKNQQIKQKVQVKPVQANKEKPVAKQGTQRKHNFLKDEDLLIEYTNKRVDDARVIKAVKVFNEQHKDLLKSLKNARVKQVRDGVFILNFYQPEGVLQFIKEKITNRYRFFLQPFFKRKVQNQEQEKQGEQRPQRQKKEKKRRYEQDREEELKPQRDNKEYRQREQKKQREDEKAKKTYIAKETFELQNMKNILHIKTENFEIERVIQELEDKKVFKNFSKLKIQTLYSFMPKISKLISQIASKYSFFLQQQPPQETKKEEIVELILVENKNKTVATKPKPVYNEKPKKQERRYAQQDRVKNVKEPKVEQAPARKLASNYEEYFTNINTNNLSEIVKGFNQDEYVKRLKQSHAAIFEKWILWKIQGEQQQIQQLLRLVHRLKKSTIYDVDLKPNSRNQKAILMGQLKPRPEKQRRPKVDVSGVNNYLS